MDTNVTIKANGYGIIVILEENPSFEEILAAVRAKFLCFKYYFRDKGNIYISFKGRKLSGEEADLLMDMLNNLPDIDVHFALRQEPINYHKTALCLPANTYRTSNPRVFKKPNRLPGLFYRGSLKKGEILEVKQSIVIIGDVYSGAQVISGGNVIITCKRAGSCVAGRDGQVERFVLASEMRPSQIKIGLKEVNLTKKDLKQLNTKDAVMAYIRKERIVFEPLPFRHFYDKFA
jgi:septum site-determining protein MinC